MKHTFGKQLKQFALSVDVVDPAICNSVYTLVDQYFLNDLKLAHYDIMVDGADVKNQPALRTAKVMDKCWSSSDRCDAVPIQDETGDYKAQSTYAYANQNPLWVTGKDGLALNEVERINDRWQYNEQWSGVDDLPRFYEESKSNVKTSIVIPLKYASRVFGFICLESNDSLEVSSTAKDELERIADALGIILWLYDSCQHRLSCSQTAFRDIAEWAGQQRHLTPLSRARVFVASSNRADGEVVGVIRDAINEFSNELEEVYWKTFDEQGNISLKILNEISSCTFGICYFSEPNFSENAAEKYIDNPNVLFEAGMLHALTNSPIGTPENWIPIRENNSPNAPFDFAQQRILKVTRLKNDTLNKDKFKAELLNCINTLCVRSGITIES